MYQPYSMQPEYAFPAVILAEKPTLPAQSVNATAAFSRIISKVSPSRAICQCAPVFCLPGATVVGTGWKGI